MKYNNYKIVLNRETQERISVKKEGIRGTGKVTVKNLIGKVINV